MEGQLMADASFIAFFLHYFIMQLPLSNSVENLTLRPVQLTLS